MVHFANLKSDMPGEIRGIAEFIGTPIEESKWEKILKHCSFDYMRPMPPRVFLLAGRFGKEVQKPLFTKARVAGGVMFFLLSRS